jgi:hypothetical protein
VLAQVIAAALLLLTRAWLAASPRSFLFNYLGAAAVAGIAFSCKAPGLVAIVPVGLLPFLRPGPSPVPALRARDCLGLAALVFAATAVVLQPGLAIDLPRMLATWASQAVNYENSAHVNMTFGVGERVGSFLAWLWLAVPSPYLGGSVLLSLIVVVGLARFVQSHRRLACLAGAVAVVLLTMMARHPLLIVRQYLMLIPLMALAFGVGVMALQARLARRRPWLWRLALGAVAVVFLLNGRWLYASAMSIRQTTSDSILRDVAADLLRKPQTVRVSAGLFADLVPRLSTGFRCHDAEDPCRRGARRRVAAGHNASRSAPGAPTLTACRGGFTARGLPTTTGTRAGSLVRRHLSSCWPQSRSAGTCRPTKPSRFASPCGDPVIERCAICGSNQLATEHAADGLDVSVCPACDHREARHTGPAVDIDYHAHTPQQATFLRSLETTRPPSGEVHPRARSSRGRR